jgi:hypothetical protein
MRPTRPLTVPGLGGGRDDGSSDLIGDEGTARALVDV